LTLKIEAIDVLRSCPDNVQGPSFGGRGGVVIRRF
jgi:hypothetical protein